MKLSANIMSTYGEESIVGRAIDSLLRTNVFDEILLLLPYDIVSEDRLYKEVFKYTYHSNENSIVKPIRFEWTGNFSEARNKLIEESKNEYIFWMDCDSVIPEDKAIFWQRLVDQIEKIQPDHVKISHDCYSPIFKKDGQQIGDLEDIEGYVLNSSHMHKHIIIKSVYRFKGAHHEEPYPIVEKKIKQIVVNDLCIDHKPIKSPELSTKRNIEVIEKLLEKEPNNISYKWSLNRDKFIAKDFSGIPFFRQIILEKLGNTITQYGAAIMIGQYNLGEVLTKIDKDSDEYKIILSETETFLRIAMSLCQYCAEPYVFLGDVYRLRNQPYIAIDFYQKAMHQNINNGFEAQKVAMCYKEYPAMCLAHMYGELGQIELALLNNSYHIESVTSIPAKKRALEYRKELLDILNKDIEILLEQK